MLQTFRQTIGCGAARMCDAVPGTSSACAQADTWFAQGEWAAALASYRQITQESPHDAALWCRIGWCHYYLGQLPEALRAAHRATKFEPDNWRPSYLMARVARAMRKTDTALTLLGKLAQKYPGEPMIRRDLAYGVYTELADIPVARKLWRPLLNHPGFAASVGRYQLYSQFYEPSPGDPDNRRTIHDYVARFILPRDSRKLHDHVKPDQAATNDRVSPTQGKALIRRPRVGLISVFFQRSPVYSLTIGALRQWSGNVDLIFIDRGKLAEDVATREYRAIAAEWHSARGLSADLLFKRLRALKLDALIDMSGWSDTAGLRALARKPVPKLFKWVGGQAASTGIAAFDGYIGDEYQSPPELQPLYAEPLINLPGGYATYTAPDYLPPGQASRSNNPVVGIISNPIKLSTGFLDQLRTAAGTLETQAPPLCLRFIGARYRHPLVQERIRRHIQPEHAAALQFEFIAPHGHENYLREVAQLDWVIDSWPYTGGLTILEALAMGVPCRTRAGRLFCERHGYSHARYAGFSAAEIDLDQLGPFTPPVKPKSGASLLPADSPRLDNVRLAKALDAIVAGHRPT